MATLSSGPEELYKVFQGRRTHNRLASIEVSAPFDGSSHFRSGKVSFEYRPAPTKEEQHG
jgi:hypothetical protein